MEGAESDAPVPAKSAADRAAALARLLHRDCTRLLELYVSRRARFSRDRDDVCSHAAEICRINRKANVRLHTEPLELVCGGFPQHTVSH